MNSTFPLSIPQLIRDIEGGKTWYQKEDTGWGSVQARYGLTDEEVRIVAGHDDLKAIKPRSLRFVLVKEDFDPLERFPKLQEQAPLEQINAAPGADKIPALLKFL